MRKKCSKSQSMTIFSSIAVEDAMMRYKAGQSPVPAYFYCSRNAAEPERSDPASILASIVRQLSCLNNDLPVLAPVIDLYERKGQSFKSSGLRLEESCKVIIQITEYYPMTTIFVDALDEVDSEKRQDLLDPFEEILRDSLGLVKIFLSSRDDQDIVCALEEYPSLYIASDRNAADIETFVKTETDTLVRKRRLLHKSPAQEELKDLIIDKVSKGADGM